MGGKWQTNTLMMHLKGKKRGKGSGSWKIGRKIEVEHK
jgi:hypothetical protein